MADDNNGEQQSANVFLWKIDSWKWQCDQGAGCITIAKNTLGCVILHFKKIKIISW